MKGQARAYSARPYPYEATGWARILVLGALRVGLRGTLAPMVEGDDPPS